MSPLHVFPDTHACSERSHGALWRPVSPFFLTALVVSQRLLHHCCPRIGEPALQRTSGHRQRSLLGALRLCDWGLPDEQYCVWIRAGMCLQALAHDWGWKEGYGPMTHGYVCIRTVFILNRSAWLVLNPLVGQERLWETNGHAMRMFIEVSRHIVTL